MTKLILAAALVAGLFTVDAVGPLAVGLSCSVIVAVSLHCTAKRRTSCIRLDLLV
jgi:hypothetical protein